MRTGNMHKQKCLFKCMSFYSSHKRFNIFIIGVKLLVIDFEPLYTVNHDGFISNCITKFLRKVKSLEKLYYPVIYCIRMLKNFNILKLCFGLFLLVI